MYEIQFGPSEVRNIKNDYLRTHLLNIEDEDGICLRV